MVQDYIEKAEAGDIESARWLMQLFIDSKPGQLDARLQAYFSDCFALILNSVKPDRALGIEKPANRPIDPKQRERAIDLALQYHETKRANPKKRDIDIYAEIGGANANIDGNPIKGKSDRTLRKAKDDHKKLANAVLDIIDFLRDDSEDPGELPPDD
jgi:hypothetical protein